MTTVRGVIFDLGYTLMYLDGDWNEVESRGIAEMGQFLIEQGLALDPQVFGAAFLAYRRAAFSRAIRTRTEVLAADTLRTTLAGFGYFTLDSSLVEAALRHYFRLEEQSYDLYPDALDVLRQLSEQGYHLGMISNATDDPLIQRLVNRLGLRPWLQPAISSAGVGVRKPDPRIFRLILDEWGLLPEQAVMVGDMLPMDILGAQLTGMRSVLVTMHQHPLNADCPEIKPDAEIDRLSLLPEVIADW